ncbi:MAG TPA: T9SS type A sorting domain-containing protein [Ignavibacteria bacterium]|nr:T9SS type A sorting domain-containing protein [Ignavibacteria bacterium]
MNFRASLIILILILTFQKIYTQYPNFRLFPSSIHQIEPTIVRNPVNQQILFASAFTINGAVLSEGVYVSTNGGLNWIGTDVNSGIPTQNHGGDPGPIIDKNGVFLLTHIGYSQAGMFANYSTNLGTNWSNNYTIYTANDVDKGAPGTDNASASPYYGRSYLAFTVFSPPFRIVLSYTTNSGISWSSVVNVNNSCGSNRSYGPSIGVTPNGTVYVIWAATTPSSPFTEDKIGIANSTNGGVNWNVNECAIDCNGIRTTTFSPWGIRVNSNPVIDIDKTGGPRNGWMYIAITNKNLAPAGSDPDIVLHRSTDNGTTWSPGTRVNQDSINNGRNQFFPAIRVDENGGVNIIYYDNRIFSDSADVYLSRSDNGGFSWNDYRISDRRFIPKSLTGVGQGNMGDNIGLTSGNGNLYPVWMSDYTGKFQIWSAIINYTTIGINKIGSDVPKSYTLNQNYPNPFNPETIIKFEVPKSDYLKIVVYDISGKEIRTLVDQQINAGIYEVKFDGSNLASGMYFYKLISESYSETRKMVLVK